MSRRAPAVNFWPLEITSTPRKSLTPWLVLFWVRTISLRTSSSFSFSSFSSYSSSSLGRSALALLVFFFLAARAKRLVPITTPFSEGEALREASFTSPALSPKMARSSFSSGVGSLSPLGVILPIMISPGITWAPTRIMPRSSRSLVASSLTLGMSLVSSSMPRLVSRTSSWYSSTWTEVRISSRTTRSLSTMASS